MASIFAGTFKCFENIFTSASEATQNNMGLTYLENPSETIDITNNQKGNGQ